MKILGKDIRKGVVKILVENMDDLWYLSQIIDSGDIIKGKTERKISIGDSTDRNKKTVKKWIFLAIKAEKIEFHKYSSSLRVSGKIVEAPEDIPKGNYHTFDLEPGAAVTIEKEEWFKFQLDRLKEASTLKSANILICTFDRESAIFALLKKYGYDILTELKGEVEKKRVQEKIKSSFYKEIAKQLQEYDARYKLDKVILASPSFWKEYLMDELKNTQLKSKIVLATCNCVGQNAIDEVLKRPEVLTAVKDDRTVKEVNIVNELLFEIKKEGLAAYGFKEVKNAADSGAISSLLITDKYIQTTRESGKFIEVDAVMKLVDSQKGGIHIISSENDGGKSLDGLGGIAALLRYKFYTQNKD